MPEDQTISDLTRLLEILDELRRDLAKPHVFELETSVLRKDGKTLLEIARDATTIRPEYRAKQAAIRSILEDMDRARRDYPTEWLVALEGILGKKPSCKIGFPAGITRIVRHEGAAARIDALRESIERHLLECERAAQRGETADGDEAPAAKKESSPDASEEGGKPKDVTPPVTPPPPTGHTWTPLEMEILKALHYARYSQTALYRVLNPNHDRKGFSDSSIREALRKQSPLRNSGIVDHNKAVNYFRTDAKPNLDS